MGHCSRGKVSQRPQEEVLTISLQKLRHWWTRSSLRMTAYAPSPKWRLESVNNDAILALPVETPMMLSPRVKQFPCVTSRTSHPHSIPDYYWHSVGVSNKCAGCSPNSREYARTTARFLFLSPWCVPHLFIVSQQITPIACEAKLLLHLLSVSNKYATNTKCMLCHRNVTCTKVNSI